MTFRNTLFFIVSFFSLLPLRVSSQEIILDVENTDTVAPVDTLQLLNRYLQAIESLAVKRDSLNSLSLFPEPDAYYYRLFTPGTLYDTPSRSMLSIEQDTTNMDEKTRRLFSINQALARFYVSNPWLVVQTQSQLAEQGVIREDIVKKSMANESKLAEKVAKADLGATLDEELVLVTHRPNFWKFSGSMSLQFTQNYATDNWSSGGVENYCGQGTFAFSANFDNEKKITWTNNLSANLGFQTNKDDKMHAFRPTSNNIVYETNIGYKIHPLWSYGMKNRFSTQIVPNYVANSDKVTTDILSPLDITIGPNISYTIKWGKKKKFTGSFSMAPLAYNIRYVQRESLVTSFGVRPGHHSYHKFGPTATLRYNLPLSKDISWSSSIYWFSNLAITQLDWSNTLSFAVNKYISATLFFNPKFDDSAVRFKNKHGKYIMFKEYLSLGINYKF